MHANGFYFILCARYVAQVLKHFAVAL